MCSLDAIQGTILNCKIVDRFDCKPGIQNRALFYNSALTVHFVWLALYVIVNNQHQWDTTIQLRCDISWIKASMIQVNPQGPMEVNR